METPEEGEIKPQMVSWSPDSNWIAFQMTYYPQPDNMYPRNIVKILSGGGTNSIILNDLACKEVNWKETDFGIIGWSPNSKMLALYGTCDFESPEHFFIFLPENGIINAYSEFQISEFPYTETSTRIGGWLLSTNP